MGLGQAFIELAVKGFQEVQAALRNVANQVKNTSANATINLGVSGANQAKAQIEAVGKSAGSGFSFGGLSEGLSSVGNQIRETSRRLSNIGRLAAVAFAGASGAIYKFVSLADPAGVEALGKAVKSLGAEIGRIFIPLLHEATTAISQISDWMKGMSDQTRQTILNVTKFGLAFAALGTLIMPIARIGAAIGSVLSILGSIGSGVGLAIAGVVAAIGLIGVALTAAQDKAIDFADVGSVIGAAWSGLQSLFTRVYDAMQPLITTFTTALSSLGSAIAPGLAQVGKAIDSILTDSLKSVGSIFQDIGKFVLSVIPSANQMGKVFGGITAYVSAVGNVIHSVFGGMKDLISAVTPAASVLVNMLIDGFTRLYPVYLRIQAKIMDFIAVAVNAGRKISDSLKPILDDLIPLIEFAFNEMVSQVEMIAEIAMPYIDGAIKMTTVSVEIMVQAWQNAARVIESNIRGMYNELKLFIDFTNEAIEAYNETVGKVGKKINKIDLPERKQLTIEEKYNPDPTKPKPIDPNKFRGDTKVKNEIVGLEDLFKQNNTAEREDPSLVVLKQQRDQSQHQGDTLDKILDFMDKSLHPSDIRR